MKNKNGYIGIIRPMDEMYKIKVMNSSKTFSTTAAGKYANEGGYGDGAIESFSEFNHDCSLNEEYPLYANIVSENGAGTGAYSEDFLDNAKSATVIVAEFRQ
ncbi:MAG: hypothetical protein IKE52_01325 [Mogibacterium sp.]|nr:hypothetical protein [Mogibacterium sp.]